MGAIAGVFVVRAEAEQAMERLSSLGFSADELVLVAPGGEVEKKAEAAVPTVEGEQPGMGKALGGVVGGAVGIAGGFHAGTVTAAAIPGVGPVIALGLLGAAVLGAAGATVGGKFGKAMEERLAPELPADELFVYEDALRRGHSVLLAFTKQTGMEEKARQIMDEAGAESVDAARKQWWIGLRPVEKEHYEEAGGDFENEEHFYRMGFEAALHAKYRGKEYDQGLSEMDRDIEELRRHHPSPNAEEAFRRGYERGQAYYQGLINQRQAA